MKKAINTPHAPQAIGPYSQAVTSHGLLFCSGQIPIDPATGKIVDGDLRAQAHRMFQNLRAVVEAASGDLAATLRTSLYLTDMDDFAAVNAIYSEYFAVPYPARTTIQVARLPLNARMEVDAIVALPSPT